MDFSLEYPMVLALILPLFLLLILLLKHDFLKLELDERMKRRIKNHRLIILFFRTVIFALLLIAVASPYQIKSEVVEGTPYLSVIIDNTSSYDIFPKHPNLLQELENRIDVDYTYINPSEHSAIGDHILKAARNTDNLLLLSDGNNNRGTDLSDVVLFLGTQNITMNTLDHEPLYGDFSVSVEGPDETVSDVENIYRINIHRVGNESLHLLVYIDGKLKMEKYTVNDREIFSNIFREGTHEIRVELKEIKEENFFTNNDIYHKTVNVIPKPKVLMVTEKESPITRLIYNFYNVDEKTDIPKSLDSYYAVILNDIAAKDISNDEVDLLEDFVDSGGGLLVVGGENSFDYGGYKGAYIETILPTQAGEGKEIDDSKQRVNIVFIIDISYGSQGNQEGIATEKAHAINILRSLRSTDLIGALAFNSEVYVISDMVEYDLRKDLIASNIQKLPFGGTSRMGPAIIYASRMLENLEGSNNIIVLSDGWTTNRPRQVTEDNVDGQKGVDYGEDGAAVFAKNRGIRIFSLGVPQARDTQPIKESILKNIAKITGGSYDLASRANSVILEFGQEKEREEEKVSNKQLAIRDAGHFISSALKFDRAEVSGFNTIVPKSTAQTLITTNQGYPIVTTWRYGLGRVISYTTDDGTKWSGSLLSKENSQLIIRSIAYAVGNPKRLEKEYIEIPDTEVDKLSSVTVKSESYPDYENLTFSMIEPNIYTATFTPYTAGINELIGQRFAVNYPEEYIEVGQNKMLKSYVVQTGGRIFDPDDSEGIVNHAKSKAKRVISDKVYFRWIPIGLALAIFLIELTVRRIFSNRRKI